MITVPIEARERGQLSFDNPDVAIVRNTNLFPGNKEKITQG